MSHESLMPPVRDARQLTTTSAGVLNTFSRRLAASVTSANLHSAPLNWSCTSRALWPPPMPERSRATAVTLKPRFIISCVTFLPM